MLKANFPVWQKVLFSFNLTVRTTATTNDCRSVISYVQNLGKLSESNEFLLRKMSTKLNRTKSTTSEEKETKNAPQPKPCFFWWVDRWFDQCWKKHCATASRRLFPEKILRQILRWNFFKNVLFLYFQKKNRKQIWKNNARQKKNEKVHRKKNK